MRKLTDIKGMKLKYNGKQYVNCFKDAKFFRLWTLNLPGHPLHRSTMALLTLQSAGLVPNGFQPQLEEYYPKMTKEDRKNDWREMGSNEQVVIII